MPLHASFASDPACIAHVAGLPDEADVLYHTLASDGVYVSGCYIAVVRSTREVTPHPGPYLGPYLSSIAVVRSTREVTPYLSRPLSRPLSKLHRRGAPAS